MVFGWSPLEKIWNTTGFTLETLHNTEILSQCVVCAISGGKLQKEIVEFSASWFQKKILIYVNYSNEMS